MSFISKQNASPVQRLYRIFSLIRYIDSRCLVSLSDYVVWVLQQATLFRSYRTEDTMESVHSVKNKNRMKYVSMNMN